MAIVAMKKVRIYCMASEQSKLLTELQKFNGIELTAFRSKTRLTQFPELTSAADLSQLSMNETRLSQIEFCIETIEQVEKPLKGLKKLLWHKPVLTYEERCIRSESSDWQSLCEQIRSSDQTLRQINTEQSKAEVEIESLHPWAAFDASTIDLDELRFSGYALGSIPKSDYDSLSEKVLEKYPEASIELINRLKDENLIFMLYPIEDQEALIELLKFHNFTKTSLKFELPPLELMQAAQDHIDAAERQKGKIIEDLRAQSHRLSDLKLIRDFGVSELAKVEASDQMALTDRTLLLEGWVAHNRVSELEAIIGRLCGETYEIELSDPTERDQVPVLLKNNAFAEAFEPVTAMYSLPSYFETDPTPVYAPFMFVFFGMMLSDTAYGVFLSSMSFWALKSLDLTPSRRKFIKLFLFLGISTMFFGVLYGSYFGDVLINVLSPIWLEPSNDPMAVLRIAIIMGVIHLFTGLGIKAYNLVKNGHLRDALFDVGLWYVTLTGALLALFGPAHVGMPMMIAGAIGLVLTQGRENKSIFGKLAGGLFGLYSITGYLGDVLSYSRLLALGLATGLIASSFNLMVKLVGFGPLTFVFAVLIFIGGHTFNLFINILGAYVHAVRLQYLEFFGKFYTGGGKAFTPLSSGTKYYNLIK